MRTTLNIEEDAFSTVKKYAEDRGISLGHAASDLIHRGAESVPQFKTKNGWVIFEVPAGTPPITSETVEKLEKAEYDEEFRSALSPRR
jgi:hypothetical protein